MLMPYRPDLGRQPMRSLLLSGACLLLACGQAQAAPLILPPAHQIPTPPFLQVQTEAVDTQAATNGATTNGAATAGAAAAGAEEGPVSATDLKAAIEAIKQRLAKKQEGRQSTGASELAAELKAARETIADLTESLSRLRGERDGILSELRSLTDDLAERDRRIAALRDESSRSQKESSGRIAALEQEIAARSEEKSALQKQLAEADRRLQNAFAEVDDLTQAIKQAWADRDAVEQSLRTAREQASAEMSTRDTALSEAQAQMAALESQIGARIAAQDALNSEISRLKQELAEQTGVAEAGAQEVTALGERIASLEGQLATRVDELALAAEEKTALEEDIARIEREAEGRLRERTQTLTGNLEEANKRIVFLETEIQGLREVATTSVAEVEVLGGQLLQVLEENEVVLAALAEVRASKGLLDTELAAARGDVELYAAEAAAVRQELTALQGDGSGTLATGSGASDSAEMAQKLEVAQAEVDRLTEELIQREERLAALADPDGTGERLAALEAELQASERARGSLEAELASLKGSAGAIATVAAAAGTDDATAASSAAETPEAEPADTQPVLLASAEPIVEIDAFLGELNAIETQDGWLMTVPDGVVFAPGSDELAAEASPALSKIASLVTYYDGADVRIVGHTDSFGDAQVNRDLSLRRANSVRDFLARNYGIGSNRIATEGLGEEQPIASNDTISGRRANRRVEVYIRRQEG